MKRLVLLAGLCAAIGIGAVLTLSGGPRHALRTLSDRSALADLPRRDIVPMLALDGGEADLVVFLDGAEGWFMLDTEALPDRLDIGFYGPRLFDAFTGNQHLPLYCWGSSTPPGKVIWVVQAERIARDFAFCNRRRMDLRPLRPFAEPVEMVDETLDQPALEELRQRIATDPSVRAVALPDTLARFTHRRRILSPFIWSDLGGAATPLPDHDARLARLVEAHLGPLAAEAQVEVSERIVSYLTDTTGGPDRAPTRITGAGIARDGSAVILPDLSVSRFQVDVTCTPRACAALDGIDLTPPLLGSRPTVALQRAFDTALPLSRNADDTQPDEAALRDPATQIEATAPVTYDVRYIVRSQPE